MTIKFPKMHVAESVVNRILNIADGIPDQGSQAATVAPQPAVPDSTGQGIALDAQIASAAPGALPGIDQAPDAGGTLSGRPLLDTLVNPEG